MNHILTKRETALLYALLHQESAAEWHAVATTKTKRLQIILAQRRRRMHAIAARRNLFKLIGNGETE